MAEGLRWFLFTAGAGVSIVVLAAIMMSWWLDRQHVKAEKRRISEYLAKLQG